MMRKSQKENLIGYKFGRLTVIAEENSLNSKTMWKVKCDCGSAKIVGASNLKSGQSLSCGCLKLERIKETNTSHGESNSEENKIYRKIISRCTNKKNPSYPIYGGRGIYISEEWIGERGFERFLSCMGKKPYPSATVERKDNSRGYGPDNCVWASRVEQANNRRTNRIVEWKGRSITLDQAAKEEGIRYGTVVQRLNVYGWNLENSLTEPVRGK